MFTSQKVGCYLNNFSGHGDDNENKELKLVFYISPITPDLANEISPKMADRLFRHLAGNWEPAKEITKASFSSIQVPMQNIAFHELPDADVDRGTLVLSAAISNLRAAHAFPDGPEFRLEFDVVVPMDKTTMRLVEKYYKSTCFLTMDEVQRELELSKESDVTVRLSLQEAADSSDGEGTEDPKPGKRGRKKTDGKSAAAGAA